MKTPTHFLACALAACLIPAAHAAIDRAVQKTFTVRPGGTVHVSTRGGNITVQSVEGETVRIVAQEHLRASTDAEADELLKNLTLAIEQKGSDVSASAVMNEDSFLANLRIGSRIQVSFVVLVPESFSADLHTSGGNISVGDLRGDLRAHTSGGNLSLGNLGGKVDATTSGGNIDLDGASGPARLGTSGGHIRIRCDRGPIDARTSGGSVEAILSKAVAGSCALHTSGGSIRFSAPRSAAFRLDASTSGGSITNRDSALVPEGDGRSRGHMVATANGGGPEVTLHTSGGNIEITETGS